MKLFVLAAAAGVAAFAAAPASAQLYAGAGYSTFEADHAAAVDDLSFAAITGRAGYEFNPFVAVEGEFAVGIDDDSYVPLGLPPSVPGFDVNVSLESEVGAFVVGRLPVPMIGGVFGRIGYANISLDATSTSPFFAGGPEDGSGLAVGAGLEFDVLLFRGRLEYTRYDADTAEFDSLGLSALLKF